jgi:hypothetical protein
LAALVAVAVVGTGACADDDGGTATRPGNGEAYVLLLDWLLDRPEAEVDAETCGDHVVFVESLGPEDIALDTQVVVVDGFTAEDIEVRFIDAREEAVDETVDDAPVSSECVLVGLGPIPETAPYEVRGEIYRNRHAVTAYRFLLVVRDDNWEIASEPEPVDPEGLVGEP